MDVLEVELRGNGVNALLEVSQAGNAEPTPATDESAQNLRVASGLHLGLRWIRWLESEKDCLMLFKNRFEVLIRQKQEARPESPF